MLSPSRRRATKRRRSSITELSFHGINTSGLQLQAEVLPMCPVQNVTYLSGRSSHIGASGLGNFSNLCSVAVPSGRKFSMARMALAMARSSDTLNHSPRVRRSEENTSEIQSLMRISYAVFCLKKKQKDTTTT